MAAKKKPEDSIKKVAKIKSKVKDMTVEKDGVKYTFAGLVDTESKVVSEAYCIEFYVRDVLNGVICMNVLMQRTEDQWTRYLKSKLIEALLKGRPIGDILVAERNRYTRNYEDNSLLDGLQRTAAIVGFVNNEYRLSKNIPPINCQYVNEDGNIIETTYQLAGRKFEELPEPLRRKFLRYQLTVCYYKNFTDDELDEIMLCVNSGKAPTAYQKMRYTLGAENMSIIQPMCDSTLWEELPINARNDSVLACVLRTVMLMSYNTAGGFSTTVMNKFVKEFKDKVSIKLLTKISSLIEQLAEIKYQMTNDETEIFDGCNVPHFIAVLNRYNDINIRGRNPYSKTFLDFFRAFIGSKESCTFFENEKNLGSGGTQYSADSIEERDTIINDFFDKFFDAPLTADVNTKTEVELNAQAEQRTNAAGEAEHSDRDAKTNTVADTETDDPDIQGDTVGSGSTGGNRRSNREEDRETEIVPEHSIQVGIAVPLHSGYSHVYERV